MTKARTDADRHASFISHSALVIGGVPLSGSLTCNYPDMMRSVGSDWARKHPLWGPLFLRWRSIVSGPPKFPDRLLLWVDAVGSYLVCMGSEVALGQPAAQGPGPDVPILGDLSRRHAIIRRDGETYSIEAIRPVRIDGRAIERTVPLADG